MHIKTNVFLEKQRELIHVLAPPEVFYTSILVRICFISKSFVPNYRSCLKCHAKLRRSLVSTVHTLLITTLIFSSIFIHFHFISSLVILSPITPVLINPFNALRAVDFNLTQFSLSFPQHRIRKFDYQKPLTQVFCKVRWTLEPSYQELSQFSPP